VEVVVEREEAEGGYLVSYEKGAAPQGLGQA